MSAANQTIAARTGELIAGRYRIERGIGRGGMGCVYLATQIHLGRPVAIKILAPDPRFDQEYRRRFLIEASTCARLQSPHIVTVHDYGQTNRGELFMAMEYLPGEPLTTVITRERNLSPLRACSIALQICRALRVAHAAEIAHLDLKPSNVMVRLDDEQAGDFITVLDFGLAKLFGTDEHSTDPKRSGRWFGSLRYMSPEQIRGDQVDSRSDIYSLGIILFQMIAGHPPFMASRRIDVLNQHLRDPVPRLSEFTSYRQTAMELEVIIARCMEKAPEDRYHSVQDLAVELKAAYRLMSGTVSFETSGPLFSDLSEVVSPFSMGIGTVDERLVERPMKGLLSSPKTTVLIAMLVSLFTVFGALWWLMAPEPQPQTPAKSTEPLKVHVTSEPSGAEVFSKGRSLGHTPLDETVPASELGQRRKFILRKDGYQDRMLMTELRSTTLLHSSLEPKPEEREPSAPPDDFENTSAPVAAPPLRPEPRERPVVREKQRERVAKSKKARSVQAKEPSRFQEPSRSFVVDSLKSDDSDHRVVPIVD